jgi:hypothetical protein
MFAIFFEIFPESWISAQKQDTRAILLKTALVHASCIQNTQIRGETIAKVFEKVDTFWTYHLCQEIAHFPAEAFGVTNAGLMSSGLLHHRSAQFGATS